jgi:hypothetical protein
MSTVGKRKVSPNPSRRSEAMTLVWDSVTDGLLVEIQSQIEEALELAKQGGNFEMPIPRKEWASILGQTEATLKRWAREYEFPLWGPTPNSQYAYPSQVKRWSERFYKFDFED